MNLFTYTCTKFDLSQDSSHWYTLNLTRVTEPSDELNSPDGSDDGRVPSETTARFSTLVCFKKSKDSKSFLI